MSRVMGWVREISDGASTPAGVVKAILATLLVNGATQWFFLISTKRWLDVKWTIIVFLVVQTVSAFTLVPPLEERFAAGWVRATRWTLIRCFVLTAVVILGRRLALSTGNYPVTWQSDSLYFLVMIVVFGLHELLWPRR